MKPPSLIANVDDTGSAKSINITTDGFTADEADAFIELDEDKTLKTNSLGLAYQAAIDAVLYTEGIQKIELQDEPVLQPIAQVSSTATSALTIVPFTAVCLNKQGNVKKKCLKDHINLVLDPNNIYYRYVRGNPRYGAGPLKTLDGKITHFQNMINAFNTAETEGNEAGKYCAGMTNNKPKDECLVEKKEQTTTAAKTQVFSIAPNTLSIAPNTLSIDNTSGLTIAQVHSASSSLPSTQVISPDALKALGLKDDAHIDSVIRLSDASSAQVIDAQTTVQVLTDSINLTDSAASFADSVTLQALDAQASAPASVFTAPVFADTFTNTHEGFGGNTKSSGLCTSDMLLYALILVGLYLLYKKKL